MKFTTKEIENFKAYREVQMGGKYNMITEARQAIRDTGLEPEEYLFVQKNYSDLAKEA